MQATEIEFDLKKKMTEEEGVLNKKFIDLEEDWHFANMKLISLKLD